MKRQVERTNSPQSCSRVVQRQFVALLFSLILSLALTAKPAQAATITVTTTADSGAGSLRQAINDAAQGDTITFNLPNPSTITLNSQLTIAKNLTIQGPSAAALTISGANKSRVFFINPGASGATNDPPAMSWAVTIADLTIANGKALGTNGNFISPICCPNMGGGGGATDIRIGGTALTDRVLVAGGGGGSYGAGSGPGGSGGSAGGVGGDADMSGFSAPPAGSVSGGGASGNAGGQG